MTLDELVVQIRVTAEGVKQGVAVATGEFRKLKAEQQKIAEEVKLKFESSGINALKTQLLELENQKKQLQNTIRVGVESPELKKMKTELEEIVEEKKLVEEALTVHMDIKDAMSAQNDLERLATEKSKLEGQIKLQIQADTEKAKSELEDINKKMVEVNRQVTIKVKAEGIEESQAKLKQIDAEMNGIEKSAEGVEKAYPKIAVAATAAFVGIIATVKSGMSAYEEVVGAQTRLAQSMNQATGATSDQVQSILELTKAQAGLGIITATNQQVGAQTLAEHTKQVCSLQKLIPLVNDLATKQHSYNTTGANMQSTAKIIGNALEGQFGSLTRLGYQFTEEQKHILEFGEESERVATIIEVVGSKVNGTNEALAKTDPGRITLLANETKRASEEFGGALNPAIAAFSEIIRPAVSGLADFTKELKWLVAGITAGGIAFVGITASLTIGKAALFKYAAAQGIVTTSTTTLTVATAVLKKGLDALASNPWILALTIAIGVITSAVTIIRGMKQAQEELNEKVHTYKELMAEGMTENNAEAYKTNADKIAVLVNEYDALIAKKKELNVELAKAEEVHDIAAASKIGNQLNDLDDSFRVLENRLKETGRSWGELRQDVADSKDALSMYKASEGFSKLSGEIDDAAKNINTLNSAANTLASGGKLSYDELLELVELYPKIAEYIAEKNDLTLDGGRIAREVGELEREEAQKTLISQIETSAQNIANKQEEINKLKETQKLLSESGSGHMALRAEEQELAIMNLNEQLAEEEKNLTNLEAKLTILTGKYAESGKSLDDLTSAHVTLSEALDKVKKGEELTSSEIRELIKLYPELERYVAEHGAAALNNAGILEEVSAARKAEAMTAINAARQEAEAEVTAAEAIVKAYAARLAGGRVLNDADKERIQETEKRLAEARATLAGLSVSELELNYMPSGSSGKSDRNTALEAELKLLEDRKKLQSVSAQEELTELEQLIKKYQDYGDAQQQIKDIKVRNRELIKEINDAWYADELEFIGKLNKGREDNTDFGGIVDAITKLKDEAAEKYKEYPEALLKIDKELDARLEAAAEAHSNKMLHIDAKSVDDRIAQANRLNEYYKAMDGVVVDGVEFKYGTTDEMGHVAKLLEIEQRHADWLQALGEELTDDQYNELQKRLANVESYGQQLLVMDARRIKEQQAAEKAAAEQLVKDKETQLKAIEVIQKKMTDIVKKENAEQIAAVKSRYDEEIKAAEAAANAEVKAIQDKIDAIDAALKTEDRTDTDEAQLDKIRRLEEQLAYETDDGNKYELQKEIAKEQADFEKRKRKENLEDEKAALQQQLNDTKNSLAERKDELTALRDAEIALLEESYTAYADKLANELDALKGSGIEKLDELKRQLEDAKALYKSLEAEDTAKDNADGEKDATNAIAGELATREANQDEHLKKLLAELLTSRTDRKEVETGITDDQSGELDAQKKNFASFLLDKYSLLVESVNNERNLMRIGQSNIISDMMARISDFANVGRMQGEAYRAAFEAATAGMGTQGGSPAENASAMNNMLQNATYFV